MHVAVPVLSARNEVTCREAEASWFAHRIFVRAGGNHGGGTCRLKDLYNIRTEKDSAQHYSSGISNRFPALSVRVPSECRYLL